MEKSGLKEMVDNCQHLPDMPYNKCKSCKNQEECVALLERIKKSGITYNMFKNMVEEQRKEIGRYANTTRQSK
jgi:hypothetical protein